jgi:hypothetical protein
MDLRTWRQRELQHNTVRNNRGALILTEVGGGAPVHRQELTDWNFDPAATAETVNILGEEAGEQVLGTVMLNLSITYLTGLDGSFWIDWWHKTIIERRKIRYDGTLIYYDEESLDDIGTEEHAIYKLKLTAAPAAGPTAGTAGRQNRTATMVGASWTLMEKFRDIQTGGIV